MHQSAKGILTIFRKAAKNHDEAKAIDDLGALIDELVASIRKLEDQSKRDHDKIEELRREISALSRM